MPSSPPVLTKAFISATASIDANIELSFTITNPNETTLTGIEFTDVLPDGMVIADPNLLQNPDGLDIIAVGGEDTITVTDVELTAGASASFKLSVTAAVEGVYINETSTITSVESDADEGDAAIASISVLRAAENVLWTLHRFDMKIREEEEA